MPVITVRIKYHLFFPILLWAAAAAQQWACIDVMTSALQCTGTDVALKWITSYLSGRTQYVRTSVTTSKPSAVPFGVPQGSVLGPILFVLYTADVLQLVKDHGLLPHAYADNILGVCRPSETDELQHRVSD